MPLLSRIKVTTNKGICFQACKIQVEQKAEEAVLPRVCRQASASELLPFCSSACTILRLAAAAARHSLLDCKSCRRACSVQWHHVGIVKLHSNRHGPRMEASSTANEFLQQNTYEEIDHLASWRNIPKTRTLKPLDTKQS